MTTGLLLLAACFILFLLAYVSRRRFGILALSMAAGFIISQYKLNDVSQLLVQSGIALGVVSVATVASVVMILLPSIVLFFGGPKYSTKRGRLIGSLLYAVTAVLFCLGAFGHSLVLMGAERQVFELIVQYRESALVLLLILALLDVFIVHTVKPKVHD